MSIVFWTVDEGMPLMHTVLGGHSHIQLELKIPKIRCVYGRLAQNRPGILNADRSPGV